MFLGLLHNMWRLIFVNYYAAHSRFYKLLSSEVLKLFYSTTVGKKAGQVMLSQDLLTCRFKHAAAYIHISFYNTGITIRGKNIDVVAGDNTKFGISMLL